MQPECAWRLYRKKKAIVCRGPRTASFIQRTEERVILDILELIGRFYSSIFGGCGNRKAMIIPTPFTIYQPS